MSEFPFQNLPFAVQEIIIEQFSLADFVHFAMSCRFYYKNWKSQMNMIQNICTPGTTLQVLHKLLTQLFSSTGMWMVGVYVDHSIRKTALRLTNELQFSKHSSAPVTVLENFSWNCRKWMSLEACCNLQKTISNYVGDLSPITHQHRSLDTEDGRLLSMDHEPISIKTLVEDQTSVGVGVIRRSAMGQLLYLCEHRELVLLFLFGECIMVVDELKHPIGIQLIHENGHYSIHITVGAGRNESAYSLVISGNHQLLLNSIP